MEVIYEAIEGGVFCHYVNGILVRVTNRPEAVFTREALRDQFAQYEKDVNPNIFYLVHED